MHTTTMQLLTLLFLFTSLSISTITTTSAAAYASAAADAASIPPLSSTSRPYHYYTPSSFATILSTLGFQDLSDAATAANLSTTTPTTIFAPSDSSLLTCPTCSVPLLLQEHSLPGLYPLHFLRSLAFGTKVETLAPNRCLTITSTFSTTATATKKVFINGVEISKPDLFNNGFIIIHGIQGFVSHLSPISCSIERMTTLSYPTHPPPTAAFVITRLLLKEAMMRLRISGFSVVALAMRVKYPELSDLKNLTVFALDDNSIFTGGSGHAYVANLGFYIVPNRLLTSSDLMGLPPRAVLQTMDREKNLVVTTAGDGGPLVPLRINYIKIKSFDLVSNNRIVVHGLSMPFPDVYHLTADNGYGENERSGLGFAHEAGYSEMMAPMPGIQYTVDVEDNHGL